MSKVFGTSFTKMTHWVLLAKQYIVDDSCNIHLHSLNA